MAVNRFTRLNPQQYVSSYIEMPFEEILKVGALKQSTQDAAQAELAKLNAGVKSVNSLPGDRDYAQKAIGEISGNIDQFTTMDFNDPSVRANWNKTKAGITQRFMPTGDLGMIDMNYKLYSDWNKEFMKSGKDAGWGGDKLQSFSNQQADNFVTIDPKTGQQKMFQGEDVAKRVDYNDWLSKSVKDIAYNSDSLGLNTTQSGNDLYNAWQTGKIDSLDKQKIINALALRAQGDPMLVQSLEQEGKFSGQTGWGNFIKGSDKQGNIVVDTTNPFGLMLTGVAEGAQFRRVDTDYKVLEDPLTTHAGRKAIDEAGTTIPFKLPGNIPSNLQNEVLTISNGLASQQDNLALSGAKILVNTLADWGLVGQESADMATMGLNQIKIKTGSQAPLTAKQEEIVTKAANAYGRTIPTDNKGKAELYNQYIEDMNQREINIGYNQYTNPKQIETLNKIYFSPDQKGANNAAYSEFTLISGEGKTKGTGSETILDKYGNTDDYTITVAGSLNPDNPYYSSGQIVQVMDKNNKLVATYAMDSPLADPQAQQNANVIHDASKAKYTLDNTSNVNTQTGTYKVEYVPIYDPNTLTNTTSSKSGNSYKTGSVEGGAPILIGESLIVTDANGQQVQMIPENGDIWSQLLEYTSSEPQQ
jgi:hypothetical protein